MLPPNAKRLDYLLPAEPHWIPISLSLCKDCSQSPNTVARAVPSETHTQPYSPPEPAASVGRSSEEAPSSHPAPHAALGPALLTAWQGSENHLFPKQRLFASPTDHFFFCPKTQHFQSETFLFQYSLASEALLLPPSSAAHTRPLPGQADIPGSLYAAFLCRQGCCSLLPVPCAPRSWRGRFPTFPGLVRLQAHGEMGTRC